MAIESSYINKHGIKGIDRSFWLASTPETQYPVLQDGIDVDVAIIGGGFVGLMSALLLKEAGLNVAVIEARNIVQGATGNTTAKITSLHRLIYHELVTRHGMEKAQQYANSNQTAIEKIETLVNQYKIECEFSKLPFYTYATNEKALGMIEAEVTDSQKLGLPALFVTGVPLPVPTKGAVRFDNQAQFHPRKFLLALANTIPGNGSYIFEHSRINNIDHGETCTVYTEKAELKARNVIVATSFPIFDKEGLYFARMQQSRSYAIACKINQPFPDGMFIDAEQQGYAWRAQKENGADLVIISGSDHPAGDDGDLRENYRKLGSIASQSYHNPSVEYSWSTQDSVPYDRVPFIGKLSSLHNNEYVATGFNKWGMTTSVVAAMIFTDMIQGKKNDWDDVYNPGRFDISTTYAKHLFTDNSRVVQKFVEGHISRIPDISEITPGDGKIVKENGKKIAVYKDENGKVYRLNPACPHLQCMVTWNNAEKTWDCPCHGSRYNFDGEVIASPTVKGLTKLDEDGNNLK